MHADAAVVQVGVTDEFQHRLNVLAKQFSQVQLDLQLVVEQLQMGIFVGAQISGAGREVFKVRVRNSDMNGNKHFSYRLIYEVVSPTSIILLTIYLASDHADISTVELQRILTE